MIGALTTFAGFFMVFYPLRGAAAAKQESVAAA